MKASRWCAKVFCFIFTLSLALSLLPAPALATDLQPPEIDVGQPSAQGLALMEAAAALPENSLANRVLALHIKGAAGQTMDFSIALPQGTDTTHSLYALTVKSGETGAPAGGAKVAKYPVFLHDGRMHISLTGLKDNGYGWDVAVYESTLPTVSVTAQKTWAGAQQPIYLELNRHLAGGYPTSVPQTARVAMPQADGDPWQHIWQGLERYSNGDSAHPWIYTVKEYRDYVDTSGSPDPAQQQQNLPPFNYQLNRTHTVDAQGNTTAILTNTYLGPLPPPTDGDRALKPCQVDWFAKTTYEPHVGNHHVTKVSPNMQAEPGSNAFNQRNPLSQGTLSIGSFRASSEDITYRFLLGTTQDLQDGVLTVDLNPLMDGLAGTGFSLSYPPWGDMNAWPHGIGRFETKGSFFVASTEAMNTYTMNYVTGTTGLYTNYKLIMPSPDNLIIDDNNGALNNGTFTMKIPYMAANTAYVFQLVLRFMPNKPAHGLSAFMASGHRFTIQADFKADYRCVVGEKVWQGGEPRTDNVRLQLYQTNPAAPGTQVPYGSPVTVSAESILLPMGQQPNVTLLPWTALWTHLPIKPPGAGNNPTQRYQYTVREVAQPAVFSLVSIRTEEIQNPDSPFGPHITKFTLTNGDPLPPEPAFRPISVSLSGQKQTVNHPLKAGEYQFAIADNQGNTLQTVSNDGSGAFSFAPRTFSRTGSFLYTISEVPGSKPGITYDGTRYTAKITVTAQGEALHARVDLLKDGTPYEGDIRFVNTAVLPPTGDSFPAQWLAVLLLAVLALAGALRTKHRGGLA